MYIIKMEIDRQLNTVARETVYQGEIDVHTLCFILPKIYGNQTIADCSVLMRALLPDGTRCARELTASKKAYEDNYLIYSTKFDSSLTRLAGEVKLWLSIISTKDNLVLRSDKAFINIAPAKDGIDWLPEDVNPIGIIESQIAELKAGKADGIGYDDESESIFLTADGNVIGSDLSASSFIGDNLSVLSALNDAGLVAPIADTDGTVLTDGSNVYIY